MPGALAGDLALLLQLRAGELDLLADQRRGLRERSLTSSPIGRSRGIAAVVARSPAAWAPGRRSRRTRPWLSGSPRSPSAVPVRRRRGRHGRPADRSGRRRGRRRVVRARGQLRVALRARALLVAAVLDDAFRKRDATQPERDAAGDDGPRLAPAEVLDVAEDAVGVAVASGSRRAARRARRPGRRASPAGPCPARAAARRRCGRRRRSRRPARRPRSSAGRPASAAAPLAWPAACWACLLGLLLGLVRRRALSSSPGPLPMGRCRSATVLPVLGNEDQVGASQRPSLRLGALVRN